ncbi:MAG: segregation/condensation protein A [Clostridia bacterium]|nr:segregation/condensation protein A [Clostridia bacterium]
MESALTKACKIKIQNFEGPFDLLFHLIEKNQMKIYDIPIDDITDQYMDYLYAMQELDLEIASEFLVLAATLLHIKSRMLLPDKKEKQDEEIDPREELVMKLIEYKKFKEFAHTLRENEKMWDKLYYKLPEVMDFKWEEEILDLNPYELRRVYMDMLERNRRKMNDTTTKMAKIIQHEKISLKSKMKEVIRSLMSKVFVRFTDLFSIRTKTKLEVVTGFLAILELAKLKRIRVEQQRQFSDIIIHRNDNYLDEFDDEKVVGED